MEFIIHIHYQLPVELQLRARRRIRMKMLVATAALATLLTSPALAQYSVWQGGPYRSYNYPYRAFAQGYYGFRGSPYRGFNVYDTNGRYLGADPDPRIRHMLAHDPPPD